MRLNADETDDAVVLICGPSKIRLVYEGLRLRSRSKTWICSFVLLVLRAAVGVTFTRTLGLGRPLFPPSKYSVKSYFCGAFDDWVIVLSLSRLRGALPFIMGIVTGLPFSGIG